MVNSIREFLLKNVKYLRFIQPRRYIICLQIQKIIKLHYFCLQQSSFIFYYPSNYKIGVVHMNLVWLNVHNLQKILLLVTANVFSTVMHRDLRGELERLDQQKKLRTFVEIALTIITILIAAVIAAYFGWIGLILYFLLAKILFY